MPPIAPSNPRGGRDIVQEGRTEKERKEKEKEKEREKERERKKSNGREDQHKH